MIPVLLQGIITSLIQNNLPKVAQSVVDKGLDYVEDKLGVDLTPKEQDGVLKLTPEQIQAVKEQADKHEEFKMQLAVDNTKDARDLQKTALQQDDTFSKRFVYYLASFWSVAVIAYMFSVSFIQVPTESLNHISTILGFALGTASSTILNFFFGSSHSSKKKDDGLIQAITGKDNNG